MQHQEKKYLVASFHQLRQTLARQGAKPGTEAAAMHFYADTGGNDVVKLVSAGNRNEIHILKESDGKFSLQEKWSMASREAGLKWLKARGYDKAAVIKMINTDYEYERGVVGLYVINGDLRSVILDFPAGQHEIIAEKLGINGAETIDIPYNKLLQRLGKLRTVRLP